MNRNCARSGFNGFGSSNVPALWGLRAAVQLANHIGLERIERRHRQLADYILQEMVQRGAESWTSPDPAALRDCGCQRSATSDHRD